MTYLHDYVKARGEVRKLTPKIIAGIMPILDREGLEYQALREGQPAVNPMTEGPDSLIVTFPDGLLPDGYFMKIEFVAINTAPWKAPDGTPTKGPGF